MSSGTYDRATAREAKFWTPFAYSFPFTTDQVTERGIIYGLYSSSSVNQNKYLQEIEADDLANLLTDYNYKMAALSVQEQSVIADIVSKRYLAGIDKLIHDQKMATKLKGIEADDSLWDAKMAALASDEAALVTMAAKVASETEKTTARIAELEAYIEIEGMNLSQVEIEIVEKEIQSAKMDLQKLETANEILRIQINTVQKAQELIDIDVKIARTKIDLAETDRAINKIELLDSELAIEKGQTELAAAELAAADSRVTLAEAKQDEVEAEIAYVSTTLTQQEGASYRNKIESIDVEQAGKNSTLSMRRLDKNLDMENRLALSALEVTFTNGDKILQPQLDAASISVLNTSADNFWQKAQAAIQVAQTMAAAHITTELTHTVKKAV